LVDVGGPFAALGFEKLREQLVGEHREGLFGGEKDPRDKKDGKDE
jgi:hypothetical protein